MLEYPDKLVLRINELYYTLGGEDYDCSHEEILILEPPRWKRVAGALVANSAHQKKTILDVGSGTGFVATVLGPYLTDKDQFICLDISQKFLDQCKLNLENKKFKCQLVYKQYNGMLLPFEDKSIDILTLNSVLHHIPNTELFLGEVDRVLKRGGYLVIGHEANRRFYKNKAVWTLYRILYVFFNPSSIIDILTRRGFLKIKNNPFSDSKNKYDEISNRINEILLSEGLIKEKFSKLKIDSIVEYYVHRGFDIDDINKSLNYKLLYIETYNHLWWVMNKHYKNPLIIFLNKILGILYPLDGKNMFLVLEKPKI